MKNWLIFYAAYNFSPLYPCCPQISVLSHSKWMALPDKIQGKVSPVMDSPRHKVHFRFKIPSPVLCSRISLFSLSHFVYILMSHTIRSTPSSFSRNHTLNIERLVSGGNCMIPSRASTCRFTCHSCCLILHSPPCSFFPCPLFGWNWGNGFNVSCCWRR